MLLAMAKKTVLQENIAQETVWNMTVQMALILLEVREHAMFVLPENIVPVELNVIVDLMKSVLLDSQLAALVHLDTSVWIINLKTQKDVCLALTSTEQHVAIVSQEIIALHLVVV